MEPEDSDSTEAPVLGRSATRKSPRDIVAPAHNGGPTETMLPLASNPAVGGIPSKTTVTPSTRSRMLCPNTDQRGVHSAAGRPWDAGAVQSSAP